jgi:DNA-directed RNA polymerase specialized sigma54-like protein
MNSWASHIITFISGLLVGVLGNYYATRLADKAKNKDAVTEKKKLFKAAEMKMPELIKEMRDDISSDKMKKCKEFVILPTRGTVFNSKEPLFSYFESEHQYLQSNIRILEENGFVIDITSTNTPRYQFNEDFLSMLLKK